MNPKPNSTKFGNLAIGDHFILDGIQQRFRNDELDPFHLQDVRFAGGLMSAAIDAALRFICLCPRFDDLNYAKRTFRERRAHGVVHIH